MAINNEAKQARRYSLALINKMRGETRKIYIASAESLSKEIAKLKIKGAGVKYQLTIASKEKLRKDLLAQSAILNKEIKSLATSGTTKAVELNAGRYGKYTYGLLSKNTNLEKNILKQVFAKVNQDLIQIQLLKTYGDGLTYSRRIWKASKAFETDIRNVVAEGIARGRDMMDISKDINIYVKSGKQALVKRFASIDGSPIRPNETLEEWKKRVSDFKTRIPNNIEYNSLRIVRTQMQGAIQDSNIAAEDYTPSVQSFDWTLSPAHKVYSICEDIEAGNPYTAQSFSYDTPPHVNCLSYVIYNEMSQREFVGNLKDWTVNPTAPGTAYLNDWKQKFYDSAQNGDKSNYFSTVLNKNY